jgi:hypothetical protein
MGLPATVVYLLWKPRPNPTYALILHRNGRLLSCTNIMPSNTYTGTTENIFPHITVLSSLWTRMFQPPSTWTTMGNEESIFCCMWMCFSTHTHRHTHIYMQISWYVKTWPNFCSVFGQPLSGTPTQPRNIQDVMKWKKSFNVWWKCTLSQN